MTPGYPGVKKKKTVGGGEKLEQRTHRQCTLAAWRMPDCEVHGAADAFAAPHTAQQCSSGRACCQLRVWVLSHPAKALVQAESLQQS